MGKRIGKGSGTLRGLTNYRDQFKKQKVPSSHRQTPIPTRPVNPVATKLLEKKDSDDLGDAILDWFYGHEVG
jgi:hypothetical protein